MCCGLKNCRLIGKIFNIISSFIHPTVNLRPRKNKQRQQIIKRAVPLGDVEILSKRSTSFYDNNLPRIDEAFGKENLKGHKLFAAFSATILSHLYSLLF